MAKKRIVLTKNARIVLEQRYLRKDKKCRVGESPEGMLRRVARNIALAEARYIYKKKIKQWLGKDKIEFWELAKTKKFRNLVKNNKEVKKTENEFYRLMSSWDFLPNSPTLFNAGRRLQQLAACYVLPIEDSMESIFKALYMTGIIHKSGGGTGFSFSKLRPRGDRVASTDGQASGPISFMKIFDAATEQIKQGGKRRGANMGILRVDHPDIDEFIVAKDVLGMLKNFNISVGATDKFMEAVEKDRSYALVNPRTRKAVGKVKARKVFHLICYQAWKNADPGIIFIDTINKHNPTPRLGKIESTNPCGEQPLLAYEACNLGSINLAQMVKSSPLAKGLRPGVSHPDNGIDWGRLKETVYMAVHFLDNVVDMCNYGFLEITRICQGNRKIGLGVMGWAEMLFRLGIAYDSDEALGWAEKLMKFINKEAKKASVELAKGRGVFPNFKYSNLKERVRNATRTTIAPTGSISLIANCSSGIEPLFAIAFSHRVLEGEELFELNKYFEQAVKGIVSKEVLNKIKRKGILLGMREVPAEIRKIFVTTHEVSPEYHVKMQAAFQKYTDNAVSKTVNFPASTKVKDVENVYKLAYKLGCKGVTIYRYGSKQKQVLVFGTKKCVVCE